MKSIIIIIFIIAVVVIILKVSKSALKRSTEKKSDHHNKNFYPNQNSDIRFLNKKVDELISEGKIALADLYYARLIESIRQQNINSNSKLTELLTKTISDYSLFREKYQAEYLAQFLPPKKNKEI